MIAWYNGPTGQKIAAIEATQSFHRLDDEEFADDQIAKPFALRRLEQVRRLESALNFQAVREEFAISTALALTAALDVLLPSDQQIDPRLMRKELEAEHRRERLATSQRTIDSLWSLYRGLTDEELEHYVASLNPRMANDFTEPCARLFGTS
ncbi:MAG: hypothetical protein D6690_04720 [Nitrospirae bacterium]|nr:MAG: hypothetical protein D6690_04720 [Nitrospirota bacterium]